MKTTFNAAMTILLGEEGGFAMLPGDEITNLGVQKSTWEDWLERSVTMEDMKKLTRADVEPLYRKNYWEVAGCDDWPAPLDLCVFDFAVNSGPYTAVTKLQDLAGVRKDGKVGEETKAAVKRLPVPGLVKSYLDSRRRYLRSLKNFAIFGKGWLNRVNTIERICNQTDFWKDY